MRGKLPKVRTGSLPAFFVQVSHLPRRRLPIAAAGSPWQSYECPQPSTQLQQQSRTFSVSSTDLGRSKKQKRENKVKKTALPLIPSTNNQELNQFVDSINSRVFQVDHIPARYRKLVLNPALHGVLQPAEDHNPGDGTSGYVTLTIDGQLVPLVPILDPKKRKEVGRVLMDALKLCKHPSDYDVFPSFIDGMTYSKLPIPERQWMKLVRTLGLEGRSGVAITIAHAGVKERRNHFPGGNRALVRELYRGLLVRFLLPDGELPEGSKRPEQYSECTKALQRADVIKRIVTYRPDVDKKYRMNSDGSFKYDPTANGVVLYMTAEVCRRYRGSKDNKGSVLSALEFVRRSWDDGAKDVEQYKQEAEEPPKPPQQQEGKEGAKEAEEKREEEHEHGDTLRKDYPIARRALLDYEVVLKGLQLAKGIISTSPTAVASPIHPKTNINIPELVKWVDETIPSLEKAVTRWREIALKSGGPLTGLQIYEDAAQKLHELREETSLEGRVGDWWDDKRPVPVNMSGRLVETEEADEKLSKAVLKQ